MSSKHLHLIPKILGNSKSSLIKEMAIMCEKAINASETVSEIKVESKMCEDKIKN